MQFDFTKPITVYELLAISLALLALILPIIKYLWIKLFFQLKLTYLPKDNLLTLFFNESGPYVSAGISLHCQNKSILLKNIKMIVTRKIDNAQLSLIWSSIQSPTTQQVSSGGTIFINDAARPMKIEPNSLSLFITEFSNTNNETVNKLAEIHSKKMNCMRDISPFAISYEEAVQKFKEQNNYQAYCNDILEELFWKKSEYEFQLITTYNDDKEFMGKYSFAITQREYESMKENIEKSLLCRVNQMYNMGANLYFLKTSFVEVV